MGNAAGQPEIDEDDLNENLALLAQVNDVLAHDSKMQMTARHTWEDAHITVDGLMPVPELCRVVDRFVKHMRVVEGEGFEEVQQLYRSFVATRTHLTYPECVVFLRKLFIVLQDELNVRVSIARAPTQTAVDAIQMPSAALPSFVPSKPPPQPSFEPSNEQLGRGPLASAAAPGLAPNPDDVRARPDPAPSQADQLIRDPLAPAVSGFPGVRAEDPVAPLQPADADAAPQLQRSPPPVVDFFAHLQREPVADAQLISPRAEPALISPRAELPFISPRPEGAPPPGARTEDATVPAPRFGKSAGMRAEDSAYNFPLPGGVSSVAHASEITFGGGGDSGAVQAAAISGKSINSLADMKAAIVREGIIVEVYNTEKKLEQKTFKCDLRSGGLELTTSATGKKATFRVSDLTGIEVGEASSLVTGMHTVRQTAERCASFKFAKGSLCLLFDAEQTCFLAVTALRDLVGAQVTWDQAPPLTPVSGPRSGLDLAPASGQLVQA